MTQRNERAVYVGDADSGTEFDVRFQLAYLSPEALRTELEFFKQAARATHMIHDGDVIVIAYHAGTKTWHKSPDVFFPQNTAGLRGYTEGRLGGVAVVRQDVLPQAGNIVRVEATQPIQLVTAAGDHLPILGNIHAPLQVRELQVTHEFVVVDKLVTPVILGVDFLHEHSLVLDFTDASVRIRDAKSESNPATAALTPAVAHIQPIFEAARISEMKTFAVEQPERDIVDECAVPAYQPS